MPNFTAKDVKLLRDRTGIGMMECKDALKEADGDIEEAILLLRKKGAAKAVKKEARVAAEGLVVAKVEDGVGVVLEVNSETDFVAKNKDFKEFVSCVADLLLKNDVESLDGLLNLRFSGGGGSTVKEMLQEKILSIGENIKIRRFNKLKGNLVAYVHGDGKIGVLVKFNDISDKKSPNFVEYAKNIAMQVAASSPQYLDRSEVPEDELDKEKEILKEQVLNSGKPENIVEKMVKGRLEKFFKDVCLKDQPYVKDSGMSVLDYTNSVSKSLGEDIDILKFIRMERGEGLAKRSDDFAGEVANMLD